MKVVKYRLVELESPSGEAVQFAEVPEILLIGLLGQKALALWESYPISSGALAWEGRRIAAIVYAIRLRGKWVNFRHEFKRKPTKFGLRIAPVSYTLRRFRGVPILQFAS